MVGAATAKLREPKHARTRGTDSKLVRLCPDPVGAACNAPRPLVGCGGRYMTPIPLPLASRQYYIQY